MAKTAQLQIRVSPAQKAQIQAQAAAVGMGVSSWVLQSVLPEAETRFQHLCHLLTEKNANRTSILAELNDLLTGLTSGELAMSVRSAPEARLPEFESAYVASMVEQACARADISPPTWSRHVKALAEPWFASVLLGLRLHLLTRSPAAFRRRNLFVDSSIGDRL